MAIEIGQEAPDFTLRDQHGADLTLSDFRGSKSVVVMFYPYTFSPVCTGELREMRDHLADNDNVQVIAISCDSIFALREFADRDGITYPLLSDFWPHGQVAQQYGVFDVDRGCSLRGTVIVDPAGIVRWKITNGLPDERDIDAYRGALAELVQSPAT